MGTGFSAYTEKHNLKFCSALKNSSLFFFKQIALYVSVPLHVCFLKPNSCSC